MYDEPWRDFVHTGPGTLAGRYLRMFWQPVARSQDLAAGRQVPVHLLSESFTLFRGESGTPYLVDFRCAHRGTQLSVGWIEGDSIRCRYHSWMEDYLTQSGQGAIPDRALEHLGRVDESVNSNA